MQRTFGFDVLARPRCGGRLRLVALIEQAGVIARILRHLGLPIEIPSLDYARGALSASRRAPARPARAPLVRDQVNHADDCGDPAVFTGSS